MLYLLDTNVISGLMRKRPEIRARLTLDENDHWVATASALGAVLVSTDQDFAQIDGLTVEDWTQ